MKSILCFDLDMTLLDHKTWKIPESALYAIHVLRDSFRIVLATGRNMDDILGQPYKEQLHPDAIIHLNGSKIYVGDRVIFHHTMDPDLVHSLITFSHEHGICVGMHQDEFDYYTHPSLLEEVDRIRFGSSQRNFADPYLLSQMPIFSLTFAGNSSQLALLKQYFPKLHFSVFSQGCMADISETGISKASAMRYLTSYWGLSMESVIAFGDSMNDFELMKEAGTSIAMGNACQELKDIADFVTTDIDQDGILYACFHLGLLKNGGPDNGKFRFTNRK